MPPHAQTVYDETLGSILIAFGFRLWGLGSGAAVSDKQHDCRPQWPQMLEQGFGIYYASMPQL